MLSKRLIELRQEKKLTQYELATVLNIPRSTYAQYELGRRKPDYDTLQRFAGFFGCSVDYLLGRSTAVYSVDQNDLFKVPIIGTVRCGQPILAKDSIEGYMYVDRSIARVSPSEDLYYLRITGDSMAPKFQPGDLVLIRQQSAVDDGEIAIVLVNDEEATLKKVFYSNKTIIILPKEGSGHGRYQNHTNSDQD